MINLYLYYDGVGVDYIRINDDPEDDYGRNSYLIDKKVTELNIDTVITKLYIEIVDGKEDDNINKYCFDRICRINKIWDKELYTIDTIHGYYGEEILSVTFDKESEIRDSWNQIKDLSAVEKIKSVLTMEYGYLLDILKHLKGVSIVKLPKNLITIPNNEYYRKMDLDVIESYKNYGGPLGIVVDVDKNSYRLIDGNHRYFANKNNEAYFIHLY